MSNYGEIAQDMVDKAIESSGVTSQTVNIDDLADVLMGILIEYGELTTEKVKAAVDKVSDETADVIAQHAPKTWKRYPNAFRIKRSAYEDRYNKRNTWYVAAPYYRLTHLLEYGHVPRTTGIRTRAFPHIQYGEDWAQKRLPEEIEKAVSGE